MREQRPASRSIEMPMVTWTSESLEQARCLSFNDATATLKVGLPIGRSINHRRLYSRAYQY